MSRGAAPGRVILFGEHAVVYGQPSVAVPVHDRRAIATVRSGPAGQGTILHAVDLGRCYALADAPPDDALALIARLTLRSLAVAPDPDLKVTIWSTIPIASGLGSGAAVSAAVVRALASHFDAELAPVQISELVFQTEILHHGTPSGVDNTAVTFQQPVYFVRGQPPVCFRVGCPFQLLIGDTGVPSPTRLAVAGVRRLWEREHALCESTFEAIGRLADQGRRAIEDGHIDGLGPLLDRNQEYLRRLEVSSPELEALIGAAKAAGAKGAKLSGAGRGGNMIALVECDKVERTASAVREAGAKDVIVTRVCDQPMASSGRF
jgi:mevalonate kinase